MLTFPGQLLPAQSIDWDPDYVMRPGSSSLAGVSQSIFLSGGPLWRLRLSGVIARGRNPMLALRAVQAAVTSGRRTLLIRPCECRLAPLADGADCPAETETQASPFDDTTTSAPIVAVAVGAAALRAVSMTIALSGDDKPLEAGMQFGFDHGGALDERLYRVKAVTGGTDSQPTVSFRPPLRAAVIDGQAVNFNNPGCLMRLEGDFSMSPYRTRWSTGDLAFVEAFGP